MFSDIVIEAVGGNGISLFNLSSGNASDTITVAGAGGHGIFIVSGVWTGFKYFLSELTEPLSAPNAGSGVRIADGAAANVVGGFSIVRNNFSNDLQHGVLVKGADTADNVVRESDIGHTPYVTRVGYVSFSRRLAGAGRSGVALQNGTTGNVVGAVHTGMRVHIEASPDAGIDIDASHDNTVLGCYIGYPVPSPEMRNRIWNNTISSQTDQENPPAPFDLRSGPPAGVGVLIAGGSFGNVFGESSRAPNFVSTNRVGIYIDGSHATRVRGNVVGSTYTPNALAGLSFEGAGTTGSQTGPFRPETCSRQTGCWATAFPGRPPIRTPSAS